MAINLNVPHGQQELLARINKVEGFDPTVFAVEYTDLITGETRKRLPVMVQIAWFRLKYPDGKISISVTSGKDCFVAKARIYPSYRDAAECYLAEATASRGPDPAKPSVSPREWAQTAAVGIALRNAGFGLQFGTVGDELSPQEPNELGGKADSSPQAEPAEAAEDHKRSASAAPADTPPELTPEERYEQAAAMICPIRKYAGRTLGEILVSDPAAINWLATKFNGDPKVQEAARDICEYAMQETTA